jgi:GST-like protein
MTSRALWQAVDRLQIPDADALELIGNRGKIGSSVKRPRFRLTTHQTRLAGYRLTKFVERGAEGLPSLFQLSATNRKGTLSLSRRDEAGLRAMPDIGGTPAASPTAHPHAMVWPAQPLKEKPMIKLYGMGSPNVVKIYIALEEFGLPYEVVPVDVFSGKQFDAEFLKLNPNAKVPVIVDSDGPDGKPYTCFESGAILLYLAEKTGKFLSHDMAIKYDEIQWLMTQMSTVGPMFGQHVHFVRFAPKGNDYAQSRYTTQAIRVAEVIENRLAHHAYLGGPHYSVADMATFPWSRNIPALLGEPAAKKFPHTMAWVAKISERPAVKAALTKVAEVQSATTPFTKAAPEDLDRVFGRGKHAAA